MNDFLNLFNLNGKTAVIIGGAGVLGRDIAVGLGKAGAKVIICDIVDTTSIINKLKKENIETKGYYVDVFKRNEIVTCHDHILSDFGKVDILVSAAGGNLKEATTGDELSFFDLEIETLKKVIDLNLFGGAILPAQIFGRSMASNKDGGSIINISSIIAYKPLSRVPGYSAAKAAVSNFTQWLAVHFAQNYSNSLRVNAIAPGFFLTQQNQYLLFNKDGKLTERSISIISHTPMARFGKSNDLIGVSLWLASDASKFVTGIVVPVDGGFSAFSGV